MWFYGLLPPSLPIYYAKRNRKLRNIFRILRIFIGIRCEIFNLYFVSFFLWTNTNCFWCRNKIIDSTVSLKPKMISIVTNFWNKHKISLKLSVFIKYIFIYITFETLANFNEQAYDGLWRKQIVCRIWHCSIWSTLFWPRAERFTRTGPTKLLAYY